MAKESWEEVFFQELRAIIQILFRNHKLFSMFYSPLVFKHCYSVFLSSFLVNIKLVLYIVHVLIIEGPGGKGA